MQTDYTFSPEAIPTNDNEAVEVAQFRAASFDFVPVGPDDCLLFELKIKAQIHI